MTTIGITGPSLTGALRMTWVQDHLAHVLDHSRTDETPGTWTNPGLPRPRTLPWSAAALIWLLRHLQCCWTSLFAQRAGS